MAKHHRRRHHRRHHRRGFRGFALLKREVKPLNVLLGMVLGAGAAVGVKALLTEVDTKNTLKGLYGFHHALAGIVIGGVWYAIDKNKSRGSAIALGSIASGVLLSGWNKASTEQWAGKPYFGAMQTYRFPSYTGYGLLQNDGRRALPGYSALIDDAQYADVPGLADLAAVSMGDEEDGMAALMGMGGM